MTQGQAFELLPLALARDANAMVLHITGEAKNNYITARDPQTGKTVQLRNPAAIRQYLYNNGAGVIMWTQPKATDKALAAISSGKTLDNYLPSVRQVDSSAKLTLQPHVTEQYRIAVHHPLTNELRILKNKTTVKLYSAGKSYGVPAEDFPGSPVRG